MGVLADPKASDGLCEQSSDLLLGLDFDWLRDAVIGDIHYKFLFNCDSQWSILLWGMRPSFFTTTYIDIL